MKQPHLKLAIVALLLLLPACERPAEKPDSSANEPSAEATAPDKAKPTNEPAAARPSTDVDEKPRITQIWGAKHKEGVFEIELKELDDAERKQVSALFEKAGADTVSYDASKMPARFENIGAVDVLAPDGPIELDIAQLTVDSGPDRSHYWLRSAKADALPQELGWTLATPAGQMSDAASMRIAEPKPVHAKAAPKLQEAFLGALDPDEQKRVAPKLEAEHMSAVSARFPSPHGQVVTINVPGKHTPLAQAVFVADDTGQVTHTVKEPFVGPLGNMTILAVADPDGDEIDGVLYKMETDGYWIKWLHFDEQGNVVVDTLAGFAA